MKKTRLILSSLIALTMLIMNPERIWADDTQWIDVSTAEEFETAVKTTDADGNYNACIRLVNDIDMSGVTGSANVQYLYNLDGGFCGKITGENSSGTDYALTNLAETIFYSVNNAEITHVRFCDISVYYVSSLFTFYSTNTTFSNIDIENVNILNILTETFNYQGLLSNNSTSDTFKYCTIDSKTTVAAIDTQCLGCIAGYADGSTFSHCTISGTYTAGGSIGGIVGILKNGAIDNCSSLSRIDASGQYTGGIAAQVTNSTITQCVNLGEIDGMNSSDNTGYVGGIAGYVSGSTSTLSYCLSLGPLANYSSSRVSNGIAHFEDGVTKTYNYYYCTLRGNIITNEEDYTEGADTIYRYEKMKSGEFAYKATNAEGEKWLYQSIDNGYSSVGFPVADANYGTVYSDILCDGTQSYSNLYQSVEEHTSVTSGFGVCGICGTELLVAPDTVTVSSTDDINSLAAAVNRGVDYYNTTVLLTTDLDMTDVSFTPIGSSQDTPFKGTFNGQGHRIKNLSLSGSTQGVGFFGSVSGDNTVIENLVIDSTCTVTSTGTGTAGIVGCLTSKTGEVCQVTLKNCGNEAAITGTENVAGLIGGVYNNDNSHIYIMNSYNAGTITGTSNSAAMVGYAHKYYYLLNCYNTGAVTGVHSDTEYFVYASNDANLEKILGCYDVNGGGQATTITPEDVSTGILWNKLNTSHWPYCSWKQDLGTDNFPTFGDGGLTYSRSAKYQWDTVVLPFDVAIDTTTCKYYKIAYRNDSEIMIKPITGTLAAGTPAIIFYNDTCKNADTDYYDITWSPANSNISGNICTPDTLDGIALVGTYSALDISLISGYSNALGKFFHNVLLANTDDKYCMPFHAYIANGASTIYVSLTTRVIRDADKTAITVSTPEELMAIAADVNSGTDYANATITLANDIDFRGYTHTPIGKDQDNPFRGTFDGQGYRIRNLVLDSVAAPAGLFGCVAGRNTIIKNTIIDRSCSILSNSGAGVAGIAGCISTGSEATCNVTIENCGNEANITAVENAAGILGAIYENNDAVANINSCYNTGNILGEEDKDCASIVAYARTHTNIRNTWNSGTADVGTHYNYSFAGTWEGRMESNDRGKFDGTIENCYTNITWDETPNVTILPTDSFRMGALCQNLNANRGDYAAWTQDLSTDTIPTFGDAGVTYSRVTDENWGTIVLPFDVAISEADSYRFYEISDISGNVLTLTKLTDCLKAGTPAIVYIDDAARSEFDEYRLSLSAIGNISTTINTPETISGLTLTGTYSTIADTTCIYSMYGDEFCYSENPVTINPFCAYLAGKPASGALSLSIYIKDIDPTAVNTVEDITTGKAEFYDLGGHRLHTLQKGVNIVKYGNGAVRKVLVK